MPMTPSVVGLIVAGGRGQRLGGVRKADLVAAWADGARDNGALAQRTRAGTGCGGCATAVEGICGWLQEAG